MNEETLEALIRAQPTCYQNSLEALQKWMQGIPSGTEEEAHRLNEFIKVWKEVFRFRDKKSRERREAMIRCGITSYIDGHLQQLFLHSRRLCPSSQKLWRYGLYGPDAEDPVTKTQKTKDHLMVRDALAHHQVGKSPVHAIAKDVNLDRKTVRKHRYEKNYGSSIQVIQDVLQKVDQKNSSKTVLS